MIKSRFQQPWLPISRTLLCGVAIVGFLGCTDLTTDLPPGTADPSVVQNRDGAMGMYRGAQLAFAQQMSRVLVTTGLLTDELQSIGIGDPYLSLGDNAIAIDTRQLSNVGGQQPLDNMYGGLQSLRQMTLQASEALRTYASNSNALQAEMYVMRGYSELWLADIFCSGVPLSTIDFDGDYTYRAGSTTAEVYQHAVALFDTAMILGSDSARIVNFSHVGQGRAWLALRQYDSAKTAVQMVPEDFQYTVKVDWSTLGRAGGTSLGFATHYTSSVFACCAVSDHEGGFGLPYVSSRDPRTMSDSVGTNVQTRAILFFPDKYGTPTSTSSVIVADGIEARLIQAESILQTGDTVSALQQLNTLRQPYVVSGALSPIPTQGLTATQVVDTLFAERAAWLFLTGHRQGDLRRLIRAYGRQPSRVYPSGLYSGTMLYGSDVTAPIPQAEQDVNRLSRGCFDRGA